MTLLLWARYPVLLLLVALVASLVWLQAQERKR
jgi:hypothetical protein